MESITTGSEDSTRQQATKESPRRTTRDDPCIPNCETVGTQMEVMIDTASQAVAETDESGTNPELTTVPCGSQAEMQETRENHCIHKVRNLYILEWLRTTFSPTLTLKD